MRQNLMLASSSESRQQQLRQFTSKFMVLSPNIDESIKEDESIHDYVERLSNEKALSAMNKYLTHSAQSLHQWQHVDGSPLRDTPHWLVIAGDQTAYICDIDEGGRNSSLLGKPLNEEAACEQLAQVSGRTLTFLSGVSVSQFLLSEGLTSEHSANSSASGSLITASQQPKAISCLNRSYHCVTTKVRFKSLSAERIRAYVKEDRPVHCAGSFKLECKAMLLFESVESKDPSALLGLPMIATLNTLEQLGHHML